jgi:hypothetical protein
VLVPECHSALHSTCLDAAFVRPWRPRTPKHNNKRRGVASSDAACVLPVQDMHASHDMPEGEGARRGRPHYVWRLERACTGCQASRFNVESLPLLSQFFDFPPLALENTAPLYAREAHLSGAVCVTCWLAPPAEVIDVRSQLCATRDTSRNPNGTFFSNQRWLAASSFLYLLLGRRLGCATLLYIDHALRFPALSESGCCAQLAIRQSAPACGLLPLALLSRVRRAEA